MSSTGGAANASGGEGNPALGMVDVSRPLLFNGSDLAELTGRRLSSGWFCIDPDADASFSRATFLDRVYGPSVESPIVEGFYLLALLDPLLASVVRHRTNQSSAVNYGTDRVRFVSPVRPSDALRLVSVLAEVSLRPSGQLARWSCVVEISGRQRPALTAEWLVFFPNEHDAASRAVD
jgi:acyl dehydratase